MNIDLERLANDVDTDSNHSGVSAEDILSTIQNQLQETRSKTDNIFVGFNSVAPKKDPPKVDLEKVVDDMELRYQLTQEHLSLQLTQLRCRENRVNGRRRQLFVGFLACVIALFLYEYRNFLWS
jgi:hypothetical protein